MKDEHNKINKLSYISLFFSYCIYFYDIRLMYLLIDEIGQLGRITVYITNLVFLQTKIASDQEKSRSFRFGAAPSQRELHDLQSIILQRRHFYHPVWSFPLVKNQRVPALTNWSFADASFLLILLFNCSFNCFYIHVST